MKPENYCYVCKGTKNMCGLGYCPVLKRLGAQQGAIKEMGRNVFGEGKEVFVGSYGYPDISWGPVLPRGTYLGEREIYERGYVDIIEYRSNVVRGKRFGGVMPGKRLVKETQEAAMSLKPVDLEMEFTKKPVFDMSFSSVSQPIGGAAPLRKVQVCNNPKVPKLVDELCEEGVKARSAVEELYSSGLDNYYISNVLSAGVLGSSGKRRMVPTRWGITATDDMVGKFLMGKVRGHGEIGEHYLLSHESLSNHFEILVMPGRWEFENFEAWAPKTVWTMEGSGFRVSAEYEPFWGRGTYAEKQAGAYYSVRLGVLEFLHRIRKQGRVVAIREIYEGYQVPVGVFQVRENVRDATLSIRKFSDMKEALGEMGKGLRNSVWEYVRRSRVIGQRRLMEFL